MNTVWTRLRLLCKSFCVVTLLAACTVNPATGQQQFAALMSPGQESHVGAQEHAKVIKTFGAPRMDDPVQIYVNKIGRRIAEHTERPDVSYKFFVLDSATVNAFALPGGYVYVTRGLLAQANTEAELAAVLAHEIGHITARHSAERYSRGVLAGLGAAVIAAATDSAQAAQVANIGSDLYIKSYSRSQESQADELGMRYMHKAGYDIAGMAKFLEGLEAQDDLQSRMAGQNGKSFSYFSTHPRTAERVVQAYNVGAQYPKNAMEQGRGAYLNAIDGVVYGDSARQGFVRGQNFYHPVMGFTLGFPAGFRINNQPAQVIAVSHDGEAAIIFDAVASAGADDPISYIANEWMRAEAIADSESIEINGKKAATASFAGRVNNRPVTIRLVAVSWARHRFFRLQMSMPQDADAELLEDLKRTTYSLRPMNAREKRDVQPWRLRLVTAKPGDTVQSVAARQPFSSFQEDRFRVLNGMKPGEALQTGRPYKWVSEK